MIASNDNCNLIEKIGFMSRESFTIHFQGTVNMQNKYAIFVQISVKHVLRNVNDILIWIIVKDVHRYVEVVLKNVAKCLVS
jgi:hypothetical protein